MYKIIICLFISVVALAQNVTDEQDRKQGKWYKIMTMDNCVMKVVCR